MRIKKFVKLLVCLSVVSCGGGGGESSSTSTVFDRDEFGRIIRSSSATETNCPIKATAFFVSGQSNAANYARNTEEVVDNVFYYFNGKCYIAKSPILGASADLNGNYFNPFQQVAVDYAKRTGETVIISVFAVGGSSITKFSKNGIFNASFVNQYRDFNSLYPVKYFLWQQGETDAIAKMSFEEYQKNWNDIVDTLQIQSKFIMARSTLCSNLTSYDNFVGNFQEQFYGPNTDLLTTSGYRYDDCHFDVDGVKRFSLLWINKIL